MKLDQIETFVVVVDCGAISLAAEKLAKTQPAVSMTLKRLETSIGFKLFDRDKYRLQLTDQGSIYFQKCKAILDHIKQLNEFSASLTQGNEHEVAIAVEDTTKLSVFMNSLKSIQSDFPNTELIIQSESRLASLAKLSKQEVQLAITPWLPTFSSEGDFESKTIRTMQVFYCVHKELVKPFGIVNANEINTDILIKLPQLVPSEFAVQLKLSAIMQPIGRSIVRVNNLSCMAAALEAKLGWGPIADSYWDKSRDDDYFKFQVDPNSSPVTSEIRIVKNKHFHLGPAAKKIWEEM